MQIEGNSQRCRLSLFDAVVTREMGLATKRRVDDVLDSAWSAVPA